MCGEYGSEPRHPELEKVQPLNYINTGPKKHGNDYTPIWRPHFHVAIFGHEFKDIEIYSSWRDKGRDFRLYESATLNKLWGKGRCIIGDLTFESAAYIARYATKKITGKPSEEHYKKYDTSSGEIYDVRPEYNQSSRGGRNKGPGGIGSKWWSVYKTDTYKDFITHQGKKFKPPDYYSKLLERYHEEIFTAIKEERKVRAIELGDTPKHRLKTMEEIQNRRFNKLNRKDN